MHHGQHSSQPVSRQRLSFACLDQLRHCRDTSWSVATNQARSCLLTQTVTCKEYKRCGPAECPPRPGGYPPTYRTEVIFDYANRPPISCNGVELPRFSDPEDGDTPEKPVAPPKSSPIVSSKPLPAPKHVMVAENKPVENPSVVHIEANHSIKNASPGPSASNQTAGHKNETSTHREASIVPASDQSKHITSASCLLKQSTWPLGGLITLLVLLL